MIIFTPWNLYSKAGPKKRDSSGEKKYFSQRIYAEIFFGTFGERNSQCWSSVWKKIMIKKDQNISSTGPWVFRGFQHSRNSDILFNTASQAAGFRQSANFWSQRFPAISPLQWSTDSGCHPPAVSCFRQSAVSDRQLVTTDSWFRQTAGSGGQLFPPVKLVTAVSWFASKTGAVKHSGSATCMI
jgi:hypothetical protein